MEKDNVFRVNILALGFALLDRLAQRKNNEAANVYKTLIYALLDNYKSKRRDKTLTKLALRNFLTVFQEYKSVPLTPLVEPYC